MRISIRAAILVALLVLAGGAALWVWQAGRDASAVEMGKPQAISEERLDLVTSHGVIKLTVEVARTPEQQSKGLMFRTSLADDRGMLFPHDQPRELSMWMRNTYIALDMVFLTSDGTVHRIEERTEPLSERIISSQGDVAAVLELAGGAAERHGLKPGDKVLHPYFATPK